MSPADGGAAAVDTLTVLLCHDDRVLTKRVAVRDGQLTLIAGWSRAKTFPEAWILPVRDVHSLADVLDRVAREPRACLVRGELTPAARATLEGGHAILRRSNARDGEPPTLTARPHYWIPLDFDALALSREVDLVADPEDAVRLYVREHLPPAFHSATVVWHLTSSCAPRTNAPRLRLFYWCDRLVSDKALKRWAKAERISVDTSIYSAAQPIYPAAPIIEDGEDWLPRRRGLLRGERDTVEVGVGCVGLLQETRPHVRLRTQFGV